MTEEDVLARLVVNLTDIVVRVHELATDATLAASHGLSNEYLDRQGIAEDALTALMRIVDVVHTQRYESRCLDCAVREVPTLRKEEPGHCGDLDCPCDGIDVWQSRG